MLSWCVTRLNAGNDAICSSEFVSSGRTFFLVWLCLPWLVLSRPGLDWSGLDAGNKGGPLGIRFLEVLLRTGPWPPWDSLTT